MAKIPITNKTIPIIALKGINLSDNFLNEFSNAGALPNTCVSSKIPPRILIIPYRLKWPPKSLNNGITTNAPPIMVWKGAKTPAILLKKLLSPSHLSNVDRPSKIPPVIFAIINNNPSIIFWFLVRIKFNKKIEMLAIFQFLKF